MLETSTRLLKALALLHRRRFWTGAELAEALGVTERSVRRDVERLRELGYPVHATPGVGGGYQLGAGRDLPPLPLDDDEAVAVAFGLRVAATGSVRGLEQASVRALAKLEQVLPKRLRRRVSTIDAVSVRLGDWQPRVDGDTLAALASACRDEVKLSFDYEARGGERTSREVEPYRLVHTSTRWYLLAFDLVRDDWRTFRVDRVVGRPRAGRGFTPRPLPSDDVAEYVARRMSTEAYRYRARVTVHAPAEVVRARLPSVFGSVEPIDDERCLVTTGGDSLDGFAFFLGSLELDFEVHEPAELQEHLARVGERLLRAASRAS